jgi:hypothetical protein
MASHILNISARLACRATYRRVLRARQHIGAPCAPGIFMTPILNTTHAYTFSHSFLPGHRVSRMDRKAAPTRRTSPVLTAQELQKLVRQMVD